MERGRESDARIFLFSLSRSPQTLSPLSTSLSPLFRPAAAAALALLALATAWAVMRTGASTSSQPAAAPEATSDAPPSLLWLSPRRAAARLTLPPAARAALPPLPTAASPTPPPPPLPTVAICAIVKNQTADLPEWLAWHAGVGVRHVFLYDHASSPALDPASPPLAPFFSAGLLTLVTAPPDAGAAHPSGRAQLWAYDDCLEVYGRGKARAGPGAPPPASTLPPGGASPPLSAPPPRPLHPPLVRPGWPSSTWTSSWCRRGRTPPT